MQYLLGYLSSPISQRQLINLAAAASVLGHLLTFILPPPYPRELLNWPTVIGLGLTLLVAWFNARDPDLRRVHPTLLLILFVWLGFDILMGLFAGKGVTNWMLLDILTAALVSFSFLPAQRALTTVAGLYTLFVVFALTAGDVDVVLLIYVAALIIFAAYLTLHGPAISDEREVNFRLRHQLRYDGLTGVLTRQAIERELGRMLRESAHAHPDAAMMLVDVDHFKQINDRLGHLMGDQVLQAVAQTLQQEIGPGGFVGRWGGEEFMVLVRVSSPAQALAVGNLLRRRVGELPRRSSLGLDKLSSLSISIGTVMVQGTAHPGELFAQADRLLYAAKEAGRDRVMMQS